MTSKAHEPDFEDRLERSTGARLRGEDPRELTWHPSDSELLAFHAEPRGMEASLRSRIRDHFGSCGSCRDAFAAFSVLAAAPAPEVARAAAADSPSLLERLFEPFRAMFAQPALVSAMVAVFAVAGFLAIDPIDPGPGEGTRGVYPIERTPSVDPGTLGSATVTLASGFPTRVEADALSGSREVVLELLAPSTLPAGPEFTVRLMGPEGAREAVAQLGEEAPPRIAAIFPAEALTPGAYRVTVFLPSDATSALATYELEIE